LQRPTCGQARCNSPLARWPEIVAGRCGVAIPSARDIESSRGTHSRSHAWAQRYFDSGINHKRGQALPDDEGAKKEGNERILRHAPLASLLPKNQVELSVDFRARDYHGAHRNTRIAAGTSARKPDVRLQVSDAATVAVSVRESVRVLRSSENAA